MPTPVAHSISRVANERVNRGQTAAIAVGFLDRLEAAELQERGAPRVFGRHPRAHVVVDVQLQMARQLVVEVAVAPAKQTDDANQQRAQASHASSVGRKRPRIAVVSRQSRASRARCFRPAGVSR